MPTKQYYQKNGYLLTDGSTNQWVKKMSDTRFLVVEQGREYDIDVAEYTEEEIDGYIAGYYPDLELMRELYGDDSNQIIAECIAETDAY